MFHGVLPSLIFYNAVDTVVLIVSVYTVVFNDKFQTSCVISFNSFGWPHTFAFCKVHILISQINFKFESDLSKVRNSKIVVISVDRYKFSL